MIQSYFITRDVHFHYTVLNFLVIKSYLKSSSFLLKYWAHQFIIWWNYLVKCIWLWIKSVTVKVVVLKLTSLTIKNYFYRTKLALKNVIKQFQFKLLLSDIFKEWNSNKSNNGTIWSYLQSLCSSICLIMIYYSFDLFIDFLFINEWFLYLNLELLNKCTIVILIYHQ